MDARLRRYLDAARADRAIGLLDEIELLGDSGKEASDLFSVEIEERHIS
jgi:hypothetical protein